jgi:hypothetical protein
MNGGLVLVQAHQTASHDRQRPGARPTLSMNGGLVLVQAHQTASHPGAPRQALDRLAVRWRADDFW